MKSLYTKIILGSMVILIAGAILLNTGLSYLYKSYIIDKNYEEMLELAENFVNNISDSFEGGAVNESKIIREMKSIEQYGKITTWFLINKDTILTTDIRGRGDLILNEIRNNEINEVIDTKKPIFREANYNFTQNSKQYTLIYPIKYLKNYDIVLLLNKSLPNINKATAEGTRYSFLTIFSVFIYAYIMIIVSTGRLTNEIQILNSGVKEIAKGNYDAKLKVERNDEIGELSRNLTQMATSLKEVETTRRKFISNISHDLRSPMTSIKGYVNGIIDGTIPPDKRLIYLSRVSDEAERMTKLINDILELSKVQNAEITVNKKETDINALIIGILDSFEGRINDKNINVEINFSETYKVLCDEDLMFRVINNLIDNAIKFVNERGTIEINTEKRDKKLIVGIRNTGSHIEDSVKKKIWQRFYKIDDSRGIEKASSGLGLSIVKEIIDLHGEKIDVYSSEEDGTLFVFTLETMDSNKGKTIKIERKK